MNVVNLIVAFVLLLPFSFTFCQTSYIDSSPGQLTSKEHLKAAKDIFNVRTTVPPNWDKLHAHLNAISPKDAEYKESLTLAKQARTERSSIDEYWRNRLSALKERREKRFPTEAEQSKSQLPTFLTLGLLLLAVVFYFLPTVIAGIRKAQHQQAIGLINLFLGWTVLGWIAALIWAVVEKPASPKPDGQRSSFSEPFYK